MLALFSPPPATTGASASEPPVSIALLMQHGRTGPAPAMPRLARRPSAPDRREPSWPSGTARVSTVSEPSIAVTLRLTSTATAGVSSSREVGYDATASATCRSGDGNRRRCPIPSGTVRFRLDGADASPGNVTLRTHRLRSCTAAVSSSQPSHRCVVAWGTDGDQWLTATYAARPGPRLSGTLVASRTTEVDVRAMVDRGAGRSFDTYANAGPGAISDCTFAAAADFVETAYRSAPPTRAIVASYWRAEDADSSGEDVGLSAAQLFRWWEVHGIGDTRLTGLHAVAAAKVEPFLAGGHVLYAMAELPAGFPAGSTKPAAHAWLVVGYSDFGPVIVTWGEEIQLSWARFEAWTTGAWTIDTTTAP